ncbi:MAG: NAD-dependent epimerase/dehydratase family protein [Proteobacteria bacterium]|nr:NAD-dependent epimerase/dehydratase family protein [Pseudomonadota bacterium]
MRVFLTGGTGLLGTHLAEELRRSGHEVVALHRREADTLFLQEQECELVEGDVRDDPGTLVPLMDGCTHVVHSAALVYAGGAWPKIRAVNVDGTRNVLSASSMAGIGHAVHVSSVAVYGSVDGPVSEDSPIDSDIAASDLYARSKREAEDVARGIEAARRLPVSIVRPCAVYGERDRLMIPGLRKILRVPVVPLPGGGVNTIPAVYAGNVAVAIRLVLEAGEGGATYDIGMDHPLTQRELLGYLSEGLGKRASFVRVPAALVMGGALVMETLGISAPGAKHLPLSRVARLVLNDNPYQSNRIREVLGWDPPFGHREALGRAGRWSRDHN